MTIEIVTVQAPFQTKINPSIECTLRDASNFMMAGDHTEAIRLYDKVLEAEPNNANAHLNKGNVLDMLGNYSDALKCYNSAIQCDPFNAKAWYNRGMTLKKTGAIEEGLKDIGRGVALAMVEPLYPVFLRKSTNVSFLKRIAIVSLIYIFMVLM